MVFEFFYLCASIFLRIYRHLYLVHVSQLHGIISKLEGLEVRILINNPNACSIDYGHQRDTVEFSKV